jgi:hypothetical protein
VIEDAARALYRTTFPRAAARSGNGLVVRCVSALWVCLWMASTAPAYLFPVLAKTGTGDGAAGVVPVSIIGLVKRLLV